MKARWGLRQWGGWSWWLLSPALVLVLSSWCQLHGSALGDAPVALAVSLPWAMQVAFGWILAGALLHRYGLRLRRSPFGGRRPRTLAVLMIVAVLTITMTTESLLIRDTPLAIWLYERLPAHLLFATLGIAGFSWLASRGREHLPAAPAVDAPATDIVDVMTGTGHAQVRISDIECLEADRNYINVHTPERSYLLRQTLSSLEKKLSPAEFMRIHRSTIVNRSKIRERRRGGVLVLSSGRVVRVSRAFAPQVWSG
jgi:DNA-binding LytR/AlgR family response regulator